MGLLIIDESKCQKDGFCASECPAAIISLQLGNGFPQTVPGGSANCNACGHCVAVCPHGALSHRLVPLIDCPPIQKDLEITEAMAVQFLRSRRSTRVFIDQPVEKEKLQRLIEIARYAPTAGNSQQVEWTVFTDKQQIKKLAGITVDWMREFLKADPKATVAPYIPRIVAAWDIGYDVVLRNVSALVVASAPKTDPNGLVNVTLALSYLDLAAPSMGLGSCWAGLFKAALTFWPPMQEAVGLPADHTHNYGLMIGYSQNKYYRLPERKTPKINWK